MQEMINNSRQQRIYTCDVRVHIYVSVRVHIYVCIERACVLYMYVNVRVHIYVCIDIH